MAGMWPAIPRFTIPSTPIIPPQANFEFLSNILLLHWLDSFLNCSYVSRFLWSKFVGSTNVLCPGLQVFSHYQKCPYPSIVHILKPDFGRLILPLLWTSRWSCNSCLSLPKCKLHDVVLMDRFFWWRSHRLAVWISLSFHDLRRYVVCVYFTCPM